MKMFSKTLPKLLFATGILLSLVALYSYQSPNGVIVIGDGKDSGVVKAGIGVKTNLTLINVGMKAIFVSAMAGCACTTVRIDHIRVRPLQFLSVPVIVDTTGMAKGNQKRQLQLVLQNGNKSTDQYATIRFRVQ